MFFCEPLNYKHPRRKIYPCPSSDPCIAAGLICDPKFTEGEDELTVCVCVCACACSLPGPQLLPGFSGRKMEHHSVWGAAGSLHEERHFLDGGQATGLFSLVNVEVTSSTCARLEVIEPAQGCPWQRHKRGCLHRRVGKLPTS